MNAVVEVSTLQVGRKTLEIWPADQAVEICGDDRVRTTVFRDANEFHHRFIIKLLELEEAARFRRRTTRGGCGIRIPFADQWVSDELGLLSQRAVTLLRQTLEWSETEGQISAVWANVYRSGDYCIPHSHAGSTASVIYCVDPGEPDAVDAMSGQLCFVDPRLDACCPVQPGCVAEPFIPEMVEGTMLIFPSQIVHAVNPYTGSRPRITVSWMLNR